ncbi:MAG: hypothetical protein RSH52_24135 [Janthinobacterium sp.]
MNIYQRMSPPAKLKVAIGFAIISGVVALASTVMLVLFLEKIPLGEASSPVNRQHGASVEVTAVDSPDLSSAEIGIIAHSMVAVLATRLPGSSPQLRVVAYGAGTPIYAQLDGGVAGYMGEKNLFVLDVTKARATAAKLKLTPLEALAFIMGHEASHLVQHMQGRIHVASRGDAYYTDPLELEAFQEGFDLVSAMRAAILRLDINGSILLTSPVNPYSAEQLVEQNVPVKVRSSWTWRGQLVKAFHSAARFWQ